MKLETTITQPIPVSMALLPQLTLPELPPFLAAPLTLIPALNVTHPVRITPLRQAFFTTPVASDFETSTAAISLPQQFDLARTHPLLASAATELARLSESAQTFSSFVFAKPAVVSSGIELCAPVAVTVGTNVPIEKILPALSLNNGGILTNNVVRTKSVVDKTDGGSLIENVVRAESVAVDKTDGGSLIKNGIRAGSIVDNTDGGTLIENAARTESVADKTDAGTLIQNSTIDKLAIVIASPKGVATQSQGGFVGFQPPGNDVSGNSLDFQMGTETGERFSFIRSLKISNATTQVIQEKVKLRNGALLIKPKDEPLLAKFGPLAPVGPGSPTPPRGRPIIDLRAMILPLEDRKAAAEGKSRNQAAAKIDEMSADADSQGGQNQDGESQQ